MRTLLAVLMCLGIITAAYAQEGLASYYTTEEATNPTASGEALDDTALTAAMWDVPLGTVVSVTCLETGKTVEVVINDRGPAKELGRLIDLSKAAFEAIAPLEKGVIEVKVDIVEEGR